MTGFIGQAPSIVTNGATAGSTYGAKTIEKALTGITEFYNPGYRPSDRAVSKATTQEVGQDEAEAKRIWWVGHCYFVERGRLCLETHDRKGNPTKPAALANFQAQIVEEISRDDGLKKSKEFHIVGSLDTGRPLPPALVPADKFDGLAWVKKDWGAAATVAPGRSLGPHLAAAIQAHSRGFKRHTVYAHSGWRQIGGA